MPRPLRAPIATLAARVPIALPDDWPALALGILLLSGIAEETVYRGYLFRRLRQRNASWKAGVLGTLLAAAHVPLVVTAGWVVGVLAILVAVLTFVPLAVLFERGNNTIWSPALVHGAADCILPLGLESPLVIGYWMVAQVVACNVAAALTWQHQLGTVRARRI
jgi:membrane protease YdiL (CAAX protease family)